jgi:fumarylacetoacetase
MGRRYDAAMDLDFTHEVNRKSWVESANAAGNDFPIQNLPFGVFQRHTGESRTWTIGVGIGDQILDLNYCFRERLINLSGEYREALTGRMLNGWLGFLSLSSNHWRATRHEIARLLEAQWFSSQDSVTRQRIEKALVPMAKAQMQLPCEVGDYTDFYASIHHATNVGSMFRPDNPLLPNYKHLPVGYHGRASSIVSSGTSIRRPMGQTSATDAGPPAFGPSKLLDYEMEMGFFVGSGNELGSRIAMREAPQRIFGMVIVNDWSARDIQKWEYQPLGPFNAKNFATTISPWVVTLDALAPFRVQGPRRDKSDPELLEYLKPVEDMGFDITVEVHLASQQMRERGMKPAQISRGNFQDMYWTIAQMLVHHTSTGCNLRPGDLLASGTISGPAEDSRGCLLERTWRGQNPIKLPDGTERKFLQDGDEVIMRAYCEREGTARIGFGECQGIILPAS